MAIFQDLFFETMGRPIKYNGKLLHLQDSFVINKEAKVRVRLESSDSKWRQGITFSTKGEFDVAGHTIKKGFTLWDDTAPPETIFTVRSKSNEFTVRNSWIDDRGIFQGLVMGAAMIIEHPTGEDNVRRYLCNDGEPDEDFDDLIFTVELLEP